MKNLQRFEQGQNMKLDTLVKLANALDLAPADLLVARAGSNVSGDTTAAGVLGELAALGWPVVEPGDPVPPRAIAVVDLDESAVGHVVLMGRRGQLPDGCFVAKVHGQSMEPLVPDGSFCLVRPAPGTPTLDTVVLVKRWQLGDVGAGPAFALKRIGGVERDEDRNLTIRLDSLDEATPAAYIDVRPGDAPVVLGELLEVIGAPRRARRGTR